MPLYLLFVPALKRVYTGVYTNTRKKRHECKINCFLVYARLDYTIYCGMIRDMENNNKLTDDQIRRVLFGDYVTAEQMMHSNVSMCGNQVPEDQEWEPHNVRDEGGDIFPEFVVGKAWYSANGSPGYAKDFNASLKGKIRYRDLYTCNMCKDKEIVSSFHVHHIDYDKKNSSPHNLITLCPSCHGKTHYNRKKWMDYFDKRLQDKEMSIWEMKTARGV